jgi:hypothetical protein
VVEHGKGLFDDVAEVAHALDARGALAGDDRQDPAFARSSWLALESEPLSPAGSRRGRGGSSGPTECSPHHERPRCHTGRAGPGHLAKILFGAPTAGPGGFRVSPRGDL